MSSSRTILKRAPRRRGTVSLTKIRRAIDTVLAQSAAVQSNPSSIRIRKPRQQARVTRTH